MTRRQLLASFAFAAREGRFEEAVALVNKGIASGSAAAAGLYIQEGKTVIHQGFGKARGAETVFLLASITKPMTAAGLMILADRGMVSLTDPVSKHIPEFAGGDRERVTLRNLLTHTSGLPDMLPENVELRKRHAPLRDFVSGACRTPLLFRPGAECRYQSMGILLAAEIAERVTRTPFREFLSKQLYGKLGLRQTSLGLGGRKIEQTALCEVTGDDDWNWNSPYWRDLGAPWGGAHSTPKEVARFLAMFRNPDNGVLKPETTRAMVRNQNEGLNKPWGIGWMVDPAGFGKGCSPGTYGHWGSTGTVAWCDPAKDRTCVLLTTKPAEQSRAGLLGPVSDAVSGAV